MGIPKEADVRPDGSEPVGLCDFALEAMVGLVRREKVFRFEEEGDEVKADFESEPIDGKARGAGVEGRLFVPERPSVANGN